VATVLPGGSAKGRFVSLNQNGPGEQVVTSAVIASGMISFSTNRPVPPSATSCSANLGEARGYWFNLISGSGKIGVAGLCGGNRSAIFAGGGLPPSPIVGTVTINGRPVTVIIGAAQRAGEQAPDCIPTSATGRQWQIQDDLLGNPTGSTDRSVEGNSFHYTQLRQYDLLLTRDQNSASIPMPSNVLGAGSGILAISTNDTSSKLNPARVREFEERCV
jgi:hypothetical protein